MYICEYYYERSAVDYFGSSVCCYNPENNPIVCFYNLLRDDIVCGAVNYVIARPVLVVYSEI